MSSDCNRYSISHQQWSRGTVVDYRGHLTHSLYTHKYSSNSPNTLLFSFTGCYPCARGVVSYKASINRVPVSVKKTTKNLIRKEMALPKNEDWEIVSEIQDSNGRIEHSTELYVKPSKNKDFSFMSTRRGEKPLAYPCLYIRRTDCSFGT